MRTGMRRGWVAGVDGARGVAAGVPVPAAASVDGSGTGDVAADRRCTEEPDVVGGGVAPATERGADVGRFWLDCETSGAARVGLAATGRPGGSARRSMPVRRGAASSAGIGSGAAASVSGTRRSTALTRALGRINPVTLPVGAAAVLA